MEEQFKEYLDSKFLADEKRTRSAISEPLSAKTILPFPGNLQKENDCTIMGGHRRVAYVEDFYGILKQVHDKDCLHAE